MTDATENTRPDARKDRAEEVTARRRKRDDDTTLDPTLRRFGVSEGDLDRKKFEYRAAVDENTRLLALTRDDDYEFVTKAGKGTTRDGEGVLKYQSGYQLDGSPQYTYLLRKPVEFAEEDRAKKITKIDAEEKARLNDRPADAPDKSYTPKR